MQVFIGEFRLCSILGRSWMSSTDKCVLKKQQGDIFPDAFKYKLGCDKCLQFSFFNMDLIF